jgi:hypothetical protein
MPEIPQGTPNSGQIQLEQVTFYRDPARKPEFNDEAAKTLVVQDARRTDSWLAEKQWSMHWRETDILYQSPRIAATFEGTTVTRANVSRFTVAQHVNSIHPQMMSGLFYENPPFVLTPGANCEMEIVRAWTELLKVLLKRAHFEYGCELGTHNQVNMGSGIWKKGWCTTTKIKKEYRPKSAPVEVAVPFSKDPKIVHTEESDEFEVLEIEVEENAPFFESKDITYILPDPGWNEPDIRKAKWVIERMYLNFYDLRELREEAGYDIPDDETLKMWFFNGPETAIMPGTVEQQNAGNIYMQHAQPRYMDSSVDPLARPLEVLERWDNRTGKVITVLQEKMIIRHEYADFPFYSANWWNVRNSGWGIGVGRLVGQDQRIDQGGTNAALDILSFGVNPQYLRAEDSNAPTQNIRQRLGGIISVTPPRSGRLEDALRIMEQPRVPVELFTVLGMSKEASEGASGANEMLTQGNMPARGRTSLTRTARGVGEFAGAVAGRLQGPVGRFCNQVFIPFIIDLCDMVRERMPIREIRAILDDKFGKTGFHTTKEFMTKFLNSELIIDVLAGAHLAAKKAMAASLPIMIQIFENPHLLQQLNAMGWTVDVKMLFDMMCQISDWKNDKELIRRMTREEQQMFAQANDAVNKIKGQAMLQQQKHGQEQELVDQKAEARLSHDIIMSSADRATASVERGEFRNAVTQQ